VADALRARPHADIATAVAPIRSLEEFLDPSCVKALRAGDGQALYFSRAPVPWPRDDVAGGRPRGFAGAWRHIGIYAYRVRSLLQFAAWPPTPLEQIEKLEQLRALEHGMRIHLVGCSPDPRRRTVPRESITEMVWPSRCFQLESARAFPSRARAARRMTLAAQEAPGSYTLVDSAGTAGYHIGAPPDPRSRRAALRRGIDIGGLRARRITADDFTRFDLILAMDRSNLRDLEAMRPANSPARAQLFLEYAPQLARRDVPDPYDGDAAAFEEVLDLCTAAARGLIAALQKVA
jgi:protein-tyrosine phosphatase